MWKTSYRTYRVAGCRYENKYFPKLTEPVGYLHLCCTHTNLHPQPGVSTRVYPYVPRARINKQFVQILQNCPVPGMRGFQNSQNCRVRRIPGEIKPGYTKNRSYITQIREIVCMSGLRQDGTGYDSRTVSRRYDCDDRPKHHQWSRYLRHRFRDWYSTSSFTRKHKWVSEHFFLTFFLSFILIFIFIIFQVTRYSTSTVFD